MVNSFGFIFDDASGISLKASGDAKVEEGIPSTL